jgi:hypothetical protein
MSEISCRLISTNTNGGKRKVAETLAGAHLSGAQDQMVGVDLADGTIQCDGYSAYDHFARHRASEGKAVLLAQMLGTHAQSLYEALDHAPKEAGWILLQIGNSKNRWAPNRLHRRADEGDVALVPDVLRSKARCPTKKSPRRTAEPYVRYQSGLTSGSYA